jgi:hypothetical protein
MWVVLLLLPLLVACGGSGNDEAIAIHTWTLLAPGGPPSAITVPRHIEDRLPRSRSTYRLEAGVEVPEGWRTRTVSLALNSLNAHATLTANGFVVPDALESAVPAFHSFGAHLWYLPPEVVRSERVELVLAVDYDTLLGAWLDAVPLLSPTERGPPAFVGPRLFREVSFALGLGISAATATVYGTLFLLDRRRRAHGWFALQVLGCIPIQLIFAGLQVPALLALAWPAYTVAALAPLHFAYALFGLTPRRRWAWWWLLAVTVLAGLLWPSPLDFRAATVGNMVNLVLCGRVVWILAGLLRRRPVPMNAVLVVISWVGFFAFNLPVNQIFLGKGEPFGGYDPWPLGFFWPFLLMLIAIARQHIAALRTAEARVVDLEAAAAELRHQVAERSRELGEAFAKMETVGAAPLAEGDRFDARYRVVRPLGAGGMGAVYEVERVTDGRHLALKVIPSVVSGVAAARFAREAEIGARLRHANLVSIVDVGIARGGTPFLVMELVSGGSLDEQRARFGDVAWAVPLLRQIVDGLAALHAAGVVHRDLKPPNVLLAAEPGGAPVAKICDFGIARMGATDGDGMPLEADAVMAGSPALTRTGEIMGTPLYIAPEIVWDREPFRPSADVFSLAVLAYEVLSGRHPFGIPPALFLRRGEGLPVPAPIAGVDAAISEAIVAGLARDPARRPQLDAIRGALASLQKAARSTSVSA